MLKAFLLASAFLFPALDAAAQSFVTQESASTEDLLTKYTNARSSCARITDPFTLYERGMLLLSDATEDAYLAAAECFLGAAVRNHTESQIELGYLYERGNGVVQSNIFAYKWYQTAVLLGNKNAVPYRDNLEKTISLDDITAALPMIQKTLELIEAYTAEQEKEVVEREKKIADLYKEKFDIDLSEYEVAMPESSLKRSNFLLDNTPAQNAGGAQMQQGGGNMTPSGRQSAGSMGQNASMGGGSSNVPSGL